MPAYSSKNHDALHLSRLNLKLSEAAKWREEMAVEKPSN